MNNFYPTNKALDARDKREERVLIRALAGLGLLLVQMYNSEDPDPFLFWSLANVWRGLDVRLAAIYVKKTRGVEVAEEFEQQGMASLGMTALRGHTKAIKEAAAIAVTPNRAKLPKPSQKARSSPKGGCYICKGDHFASKCPKKDDAV